MTNGQEKKRPNDQTLIFLEFPNTQKVVEMQILRNHNFHFHFKAHKVFHKIKFAKYIVLSNKKCGGPEHLVFHSNTALQATLNILLTGSRFGSGFGGYEQQ